MYRGSQTDPRERSLPKTREPRLKQRAQDQRAAPETTNCPRSEGPDRTEVAAAGEGGKKHREVQHNMMYNIIHIYVCICVHICMYNCYVYMCICICIYVYIYIHVYIYIYTHIYIHMCVYIYIYIYDVCIYIYICITERIRSSESQTPKKSRAKSLQDSRSAALTCQYC